MGDSITAASNSAGYWNLLKDYAGIEPFCYGKNGYKFFGLLEQAQAVLADRGDDVDAVFLLAGTNDFRGGVPLGEWYVESEKRVFDAAGGERFLRHREFNFDEKTFKGGINSVLSFVRKHYWDKEIVLMTPIHRAFACFGADNVQYDEMHANSIGVFFDEYVNAVKQAANVWSVELIDLNCASGLFPLNDDNAKKYFCNTETDRLHPNAEGHRLLADVIAKKMININV